MKILITKDTLEIKLQGMEKVWAVKGSLSIPLDNIVGVSQGHPPMIFKDFRLPGTYLPGVLKAGSYYCKRNDDWHWEFWYRNWRKETVTIDLKDEKYSSIVLSVEDSFDLVDRISDAMGKTSP